MAGLRKKKRKRQDEDEEDEEEEDTQNQPTETERKLLIGSRVEVRSVEEGFVGSWHCGTVVACSHLCRVVEYDHYYSDDAGLENLKDKVRVSPLVEGILLPKAFNYRGIIRPIPPPRKNETSGLNFGLCVDAFIDDAWWEGVIFDYEDELLDRLVFFPDFGDRQMIQTDELRVTQDWDEVEECWIVRGHWKFLELIEEFPNAMVSAGQIWNELRRKEGFKNNIKEWTCDVKSKWVDLVVETVSQNLDISAELVHKVISEKFGNYSVNDEGYATNRVSSCDDDEAVAMQIQDLSVSHSDELKLLTRNVIGSSLIREIDDVTQEERGVVVYSDKCILPTCYTANEEDEVQGVGTVVECTVNGSSSDDDYLTYIEPSLGRRTHMGLSQDIIHTPTDSGSTGKLIWLPVGTNVLPEAKYFPEALDKYLMSDVLKVNNNDFCARDLQLEARMHLSYMGWRIEYKPRTYTCSKSKRVDLRYISPKGGKPLYSLRRACLQAMELAHCQQVPLSMICIKDQGCASQPPFLEPGSLYSNTYKSRRTPFVRGKFDVHVVPEYCPQAVSDYLNVCQSNERHSKHAKNVKHLREKVKKHLSAEGWTFSLHILKDNRRDLRYTSPSNSASFKSLVAACMYVKEVSECMSPSSHDKLLSITMHPDILGNTLAQNGVFSKWHPKSSGSSQQSKDKLDVHVEPEYCPQAVSDYLNGYQSNERRLKHAKNVKHLREKVKKHLSAEGWTFSLHILKDNRRDLRYTSPSSSTSFKSLVAACIGYVKEVSLRSEENSMKTKVSGLQSDDEHSKIHVPRSSKRARQIVIPRSAHCNPRTILCWLIENDVVLPRAKVCYLSVRDDSAIGQGKINRNGIKCNCCQNVFGLYKFGLHVGSCYTPPSARIFLEDGRSLLDCQKLLLEKCSNIYAQKRDLVHKNNDDICSICHHGGTLLLCDQCPSSFHLNCLGLEDVPDGKWFCPSCQCRICGQQSKLDSDSEEHLAEEKVLCCDQCNHEYHVRCVRKRGLSKLDHNNLKSNWFCSMRCEKIFAGLHKLLGESVPVGKDNLSWTILKSAKDACQPFAPSENEAVIESQSKLNVALAVIHECFEPIKHTSRDLIEDVLFNKTSELNRLNFWGFYTVLLERDDELISVAAVRIHDEKLAEVPFVCTRVQHRRQGMCHILFDVLEEMLRQLEVERVILPAIPQVLHTWTTSFGFSKMTNSERLEFLHYTFLDFQDARMCQKILRTLAPVSAIPIAEVPREVPRESNASEQQLAGTCTLVDALAAAEESEQPTPQCAKLTAEEPRGNQPQLLLKFKRKKENVDTNWNITIPAAIQAERLEWDQVADQQLVVEVGGKNVLDLVVMAPPLDVTTQQDISGQNWRNSEPCIAKKFVLDGWPQEAPERAPQVESDRNLQNRESGDTENSALVVYDECRQEKRSSCVKFYTRRKILGTSVDTLPPSEESEKSTTPVTPHIGRANFCQDVFFYGTGAKNDHVVTARPLNVTTTLQDESERNRQNCEPYSAKKCFMDDKPQDYRCTQDKILEVNSEQNPQNRDLGDAKNSSLAIYSENQQEKRGSCGQIYPRIKKLGVHVDTPAADKSEQLTTPASASEHSCQDGLAEDRMDTSNSQELGKQNKRKRIKASSSDTVNKSLSESNTYVGTYDPGAATPASDESEKRTPHISRDPCCQDVSEEGTSASASEQLEKLTPHIGCQAASEEGNWSKDGNAVESPKPSLDCGTEELENSDCDESFTQLVDELKRQGFDDSDGEEMGTTLVLEDDSDDDECEIGGGGTPTSCFRKRRLDSPCEPRMKDDVVSDTTPAEKSASGSVMKSSMSELVALWGSSESAACIVTKNICNDDDEMADTTGDPISVISRIIDEELSACDGNLNMKEGRHISGISVVKKLSYEDTSMLNDFACFDDNDSIVEAKDSSSPAFEHKPAGLSYFAVSHDEPGEWSQNNDIVDRFLSLNNCNLSQEVVPEKIIKEVNFSVSRLKGTCELAKRRTVGSPIRDLSIFDWHDFDLHDTPKPGGVSCERETEDGNSSCKRKKGLNLARRITDLPHSDSRLMSDDLKGVRQAVETYELESNINILDFHEQSYVEEVQEAGISNEFDAGSDTIRRCNSFWASKLPAQPPEISSKLAPTFVSPERAVASVMDDVTPVHIPTSEESEQPTFPHMGRNLSEEDTMTTSSNSQGLVKQRKQRKIDGAQSSDTDVDYLIEIIGKHFEQKEVSLEKQQISLMKLQMALEKQRSLLENNMKSCR